MSIGLQAGMLRYVSASFDPLDLSPSLWLDASDSATLYDATSGGSLVAAAGTVARWEDKSGNAYHVTQATAGNRPTRQTSIKNGLDCLLFSSDLLERATVPIVKNAAGGTVFAVVDHTATPTTHRTTLQVTVGGGTVARLGLGAGLTSQKPYSVGRRLDADGSAFATGSATTPAGFYIHSARVDYSATVKQYINGAADGTVALANPGSATSNTNVLAVYIGAGVGAAVPLDGYLAEVFVFDRELTTTEHDDMIDFLTAKWAI